MSLSDGQARQIIEQADKLLKKVQQDLDDSDDFFRDAGLDRAELAKALTPYQNEEQQEALQRQLEADQDDIRRQVEVAASQTGLSVPTRRPGRRPRPLV